MKCNKCGAELQENSVFCNICGEKVVTEEVVNSIVEEPKNQPIQEEIIEPKEEVVTSVVNKEPQVQPVDETKEEITEQNEEVVTHVVNEKPQTQPVQEMKEEIITQKEEVVNQFTQPTPITTTVSQSTVNVTSSKKKSNLPFIIILIVLIVAIIGLSIFIATRLIDDRDTNVNDNNPTTSDVTKPENSKDNTESKPQVDSTVKIKVNNFEFTLPSGYEYQQKESGYSIMDSNKVVLIQLNKVVNDSISKYASDLSILQTELEKNGATIINSSVKTYGAYKYIIYEATYSNSTIYYYLAQVDNSNIAIGAYAISKSTTNENALSILNKILVTGKLSSESNSESFNGEIPSFDNSSEFTKKLQ